MSAKRLPLSKTLSYNLPSSPVDESTASSVHHQRSYASAAPARLSFPTLQQSPPAAFEHRYFQDDVPCEPSAQMSTDDLGCLSPSPSPDMGHPPPPPPPSNSTYIPHSRLNPIHSSNLSRTSVVIPSYETVPCSSSSSSNKQQQQPVAAKHRSGNSKRFASADVFSASKPVTCRSLNDIADSFDKDVQAESMSNRYRQVIQTQQQPQAVTDRLGSIPADSSFNRTSDLQQGLTMPQPMHRSMNNPSLHSYSNMSRSTNMILSEDTFTAPQPAPSRTQPSVDTAQTATGRLMLNSLPPKPTLNASNHFVGNSIQINQYGTSASASAPSFPFNSEDIAMALQAQRTHQQEIKMSQLPPTYPINLPPRPIQAAPTYRNAPIQRPLHPPQPSLPFHAPIPAARATTTAISYDNIPPLESSGVSFRQLHSYAPSDRIRNASWLHPPAIVASHPAAQTWINQQSQQMQYQQQYQQEPERVYRDNDQPAVFPAMQHSEAFAADSLSESGVIAPFRPNAKLGNTGKLDAYFGVPRDTSINKMNTPRKRRSILEQPASISSAAAPTVKKKRKRQMRQQQAPIEIDDDEEMPLEYEENGEDNDAVENSEIEAAASSSFIPNKSTTSPGAAADLSKFNQLFSSQGSGYSGRALSYLKTKHMAQDLSDPTSSALADFHACVMKSEKWTMCILNQDLSTNFRVQTKEQKKFLKNMVGEAKRTDGDQSRVWNGGIKPPTMLVVEFFTKKPTENAEKENTDAPSNAISSTSDAKEEEFSMLSINPYPYSIHYVSQYDRSGLFILPMFAPINMTVDRRINNNPEINQIQHNWSVRREFLSLLQSPPEHIHCVVFDAKALICAVMIHFHVSSLDVDLIPRLNDALMAAWLCDPDDYRNTEFNIDALVQAYCPMQRVQLGRIGLTAGDKDIDVMMQDMRDSLVLFDRLVQRMDREQLIPACVRQEMPLLPVVIDMQVRGVAVNNTLFQQAEEKLKAKIEDTSLLVHEVAGHPICLASAAQVAKVLYEEFDVPPPKIVDKGRSQAKEKTHLTTSQIHYCNDHALRCIISDTKVVVGARKIAEAVLRFRAWYKVLTGYLIPWGKSTVSDGNLMLEYSSNQLRICPIWNQFATGTGRLSCCNPNLQATPKSSVKRGLTLEDDNDKKHIDEVEEGNMGEEMNQSTSQLDSPIIGESASEPKEARPVNLPIDINMRSVLIPTPAHIVQRISRDRMATLDLQSGQLLFPADAIDQAQHATWGADRILLSADYSQMEVRLLAQLSKDPSLIRVFKPSYQVAGGDAESSSSTPKASVSLSESSGDVYRRMASIMFIKDMDQVSDAERNISKTIVLGVMYGMGADSLAGKLTKFSNKTVTQKDAQSYINKLYEQFPMVKSFMNNTRADGAQYGYVPTLIGRRRYLPDLKSTSGQKKAYAERQAVNTVIQGSAADMTKMAMIGIRTRLRQEPLLRSSVSLIMQLHDEIVLELPMHMVHTVALLVREVMENVMPTASVPFTTNIKVGREGLGELEPYEVYCQQQAALQ